MRKDMSKIHTEPSRRPDRKVAKARSRYFARTPLEELPLREDMRSPWHGYRREQSRSYAPLHRFLASRVGHSWDAVYSEICRRNKMDNFAEYKTREWLTDQVERNVHMVGDTPYGDRDYPLTEGEYYVDPRDGVLKVVPKKDRVPCVREPDTYPQVRINDTQRYVLVKGCWFIVTFAPLAEGNGALLPKDTQDVILRLPPNADRWSYIREWHGSVYAASKQQIGGGLLKRLRKRGVLPTA